MDDKSQYYLIQYIINDLRLVIIFNFYLYSA